MALGDPFSTTYAGSFEAGQSLGKGLDSAADDFAKAEELKKKRQMTYDILKSTGQISEQVTPPSEQELMQGLEKFGEESGHKVNFNIASDATPEQRTKFLTTLYKQFSIPMPEGNKQTTLNLQPGTSFNPGTGELVLSGKEKTKTLPEQIAEYSTAQRLLEKAGLENTQVNINGKGQASLKPESTWNQRLDINKEAVPAIYEAVKDGDFSGYKSADKITKTMIAKQAAEEGINLTKLEGDYNTMMQKSKTAGGAPVMRLDTAIGTLDQSLTELDRLNEEYKRTDILPSIANRIKLQTDKEGVSHFGLDDTSGLNSTQQKLAMKYLYQLNNSLDMQALVYSGGFAPQDWAFKMAASSMSPYYGTGAMKAVTGQARKDIQMRVNASNQFFGKKQVADIGQTDMPEQPQGQSFSSEEEAMKANLPSGSEVIINGRRARID